MASTVIELKALGIDKVVERMKLSKLASHIVKSLHEMTTRKDRASPGKDLVNSTTHHSTANTGGVETQYTGPTLTVRVEPPPTPPEMTMDSTMLDGTTHKTCFLNQYG